MHTSETQSQDRPLTPAKDERRAGHRDRGRMLLILLAILVYISLSEYLSTTMNTVQIGLVMHGIALVALLLLAALVEDPAEQRVYLTLGFAPLIRLVSLSLPLQNLPMMYWYLLVGAPITLSIFMVIRYGRFSTQEVGLTARYWFLQLLFGLVGIGLGYVEYLILRPEPLASEFTLRSIWFPAFILVVFTGFLEEIIFRGLMQTAFAPKLGRWVGIVLISTLFAVLHLGYHSLLDVVFVFAVAMLFAAVTEWTGSIWGVSIAHGLTNVTLFLVFPFIIGQGLQPFSQWQLSNLFTREPTPSVQTIEAAPSLSPFDATLSPFGATLTMAALSPTDTLTPTATETFLPSETPSITPTVMPILVDCNDPGFIRQGGEHWEAEQGYRGHLVWTYTRLEEPDVFITYQPEVMTCGRYRFEVYIPADFGLAQAVRYEIAHRDGTTRVEIDQEANQGQWTDLGDFWCDAGQGCRVDVDNLVGLEYPITFVAFDALRLTFTEGCP